MSSTEHAAHAGHHEMSFIRKYIFSTDHKVIAIQFLFAAMFFGIIGALLSVGIRWQVGFPHDAVPLIGKALFHDSAGVMVPEFYNMLFTMHGTIMVFFVVMPLLVGYFANYLIPLQIGAPDMAFPTLNMISFWTFALSGVVVLVSFVVTGGAASAGWTGYAPLSAVGGYTGAALGQSLWCVALFINGFASIFGAVNYITTTLNMRAPGMTMFRMPLAVWSLFITAWLLLLAIPVVAAAFAMLFLDQNAGTTFFLHKGGGQALLWQHLFWFFAHPEVYILILPAMGVGSDLIAAGVRKPIFGYHSMVFAITAIAFLGWIVWGHHMFVSGMSPVLGSSFMVSTMVIAVPSAIKVFNWLGTIWRGQIRFTVPTLFGLAFVSMFIIGGLSGIFMASTPVDIFIHDTYLIVAHFHYVVVGGSLFAIMGGIYYWFPKMFGRMMNDKLGKVHFWLTFVTYNLTFFPMHILGVGGQMRRLYDPTVYPFLAPMQPVNEFISYSAFALVTVQILFFINFFWSLFKGPKAERNPWQSCTLEWVAASPPPHGNFDVTPTVYRGPYEYSSGLTEDDYIPQNKKIDTAVAH